MSADVAPRERQARRCASHVDRPARAVCMRCRKLLCQECATPSDGIHYCVLCLGLVRGAAGDRRSHGPLVAVLFAVAGLFWLVPRVLVTMGVLLAGLR